MTTQQSPTSRPAGGAYLHDAAGPPLRVLYSTLRFVARHVRGFGAAVFVFLALVLGAWLALTAMAVALAGVATPVVHGFDESALHWLARHRTAWLDEVMIRLSTLGSGYVLVAIAIVASVFLSLTAPRWTVYLLMFGVVGGHVVNNLLKLAFDRPRPEVVEWIDSVRTTSFPSGHAMGAIIAWGSIAYIAAQLGAGAALRRTVWTVAVLLIAAIGISRVYLGVHYPTDVLGGYIAGIAWLVFVAAALLGVQFLAARAGARSATEGGE
jgi:membrane-associated phospholipid phosphatase